MKIGDREISLSHGAHKPNEGGACVMEVTGVKWLMQHGWSLTDAWNALTDTPPCTDPLIYRAAQRVNDRLSDVGLLRLELRVDRLMSCHTPSDPVKARRVRVRVACWSARRVLHLIVDDERRAVALRAIETAEAWLRGESDEEDCRAAAASAYASADATADAAAAAYAAYAYAVATADAYAYAAYAYAAAYADADAAAAASASAYAAAVASAYAAAFAYAAADADAAVAVAAAASAYAAAAASAYADSSEREDALFDFLDDLLDQWSKAVAAEGCAADEPPVPEHVA